MPHSERGSYVETMRMVLVLRQPDFWSKDVTRVRFKLDTLGLQLKSCIIRAGLGVWEKGKFLGEYRVMSLTSPEL